MWLLAVAFIAISSSNYKPQWIAQTLSADAYRELENQSAVSHLLVNHVWEKNCRPSRATGLSTERARPLTSRVDAC